MATWLFLTSMRPGCHVLGHWYNSSELFQMLPRCFKLQNISLFPPPFYQIENFRQRWRQRPGGCRPTCWSKRDTHSTSTSTWPATSTCPACPARPRNLILKPGTGTCWTQCLRWAYNGCLLFMIYLFLVLNQSYLFPLSVQGSARRSS